VRTLCAGDNGDAPEATTTVGGHRNGAKKSIGTNVSLFVGGDEHDTPVGRKGGISVKSTSTNLKFVPILALLGVTGTLAITCPNKIIAYIPFLLVASKVGKPRNKIEVAQGMALGVMWNTWAAVLTLVLSFGYLPLAAGAVLPYVCILSIFLREDISTAGWHGYFLIRFLVDPPLLAIIFATDALGGRFLHDGAGNFLSVIDDHICMSSMPLSSNLPEMREANIRSVVNMCVEYGGPQAGYQAAGIEQLRLPTLDTNQPSFQHLKEGVEFIKRRIKEEPGAKVLIHCKGGRGRAAALTACYYISQGMSPEEAITMMKKKRSVVEPVVTSYPTVMEYAAYSQAQKQ